MKEKAHEIWQLLPQYSDVEEPKWSNGWLDRFKKRHNIKKYSNHGEAGAAAIEDAENIRQMETVRNKCKLYLLRDILNIDEIGLFWKLAPTSTLATGPTSGGKKLKDRVTVAFTVNADGSEEFDPWIVAKSENPRCFKNIDRRKLGIMYRFNKTKWMTGLIIEEYLRWLNNIMAARGRKVLLLMDNFSGHELGVELCGGKTGLSNVEVEWLPPNTTSHWQPLDQGIIASFKLHYRKQWIRYMLREYEAERDPLKTVTLLHAIQWTIESWKHHVRQRTIQACFWKSTVVKKERYDKDVPHEIDNQWDQEDARVLEDREELRTAIRAGSSLGPGPER